MSNKRRRARTLPLPVRVVPRERWGVALEVGGVVQSVSVPDGVGAVAGDERLPQPGPGGGYWGLLLPVGCPRRALLLGLGGGTVAHLLARRCPGVQMLGIERDERIVSTALSEMGLAALEQLRIVEADAFAWVAEQAAAAPGSFDLVCVDLFDAGRLVPGTLATPFLRQIGSLMRPGGVLTMNLMVTARTPDQIHRLARVFTVERELRLRGNLVIHARANQDVSPD